VRLNTRLLIALLPAVTVIMAGYGYWALAQRTAVLGQAARSETRAYSTAVVEAFEHAFRDLQFEDVSELIDELSRQPRVYGVIIYDTLGAVTVLTRGMSPASAVAPERVRGVVASGASVELERDLEEERVFSILGPVRGRGAGQVTGVVEVLQPLSLIEEERARTAQRFLLNTLTLVGALAVLTAWVVRRLVHRPLESFTDAIRQVGRGDLSRRVAAEGAGQELGALGWEFNRMADALETARDALIRETDERLALEARLRHQERLASMGTLAAGVAHQISAPLNVIAGRAQLLLRRRPDADKLEADLGTIAEQAERIERIVRGLLDFARQPEPRVRAVALGDVIRGAVHRFGQDFAEARVRAKVDAPEPLSVAADPDLLEEVMVILLSNALEAVREIGGGEVAIRVRRVEEDALVEIADTGPGISPEHAPRVFEAFFTTKPGGTGLGLAVAHAIVDRLGGAIGVRAGPGGAIWFRLPLHREVIDA